MMIMIKVMMMMIMKMMMTSQTMRTMMMMMTLTRHWPCRQQWQYPGACLPPWATQSFSSSGSSSSSSSRLSSSSLDLHHQMIVKTNLLTTTLLTGPRHFSAIVGDLHGWSYLSSENDRRHHIDHNQIPQDNAHGHDDKSDKNRTRRTLTSNWLRFGHSAPAVQLLLI